MTNFERRKRRYAIEKIWEKRHHFFDFLKKMKTILSTDDKIDMIFWALFGGDKKKEEEFFWNCLTKKEIEKFKKREKEEEIPFENLQ